MTASERACHPAGVKKKQNVEANGTRKNRTKTVTVVLTRVPDRDALPTGGTNVWHSDGCIVWSDIADVEQIVCRDGDGWSYRVEVGGKPFVSGCHETKAAASRAARVMAGDARDFQRAAQA